jgi:hypothetical protein
MDFESLPNVMNQRDGQLSTQMFAKLFQATRNPNLTGVIFVKQFRGEQFEPQSFKEDQNPLGCGGR